MALLITLAIVGLMYLMMYVEIPTGSREVIMLVIGGLLARMNDVYSFYFGSSEGSQRKTEIMGMATAAPVASDDPAPS
jgi:hypothetical protein